jgi:aconitate hydratase
MTKRAENLAYKIIRQHMVAADYRKLSQDSPHPFYEGDLIAGQEINLIIDQTLTQDATGTMAYLQLEKLGIDQVRTLALSYVDHNTLQSGFMNADDHKYLQTVANRYGVLFSKAGNGICHQVHLERFDKPGQTLLGSDSHTPTAGAMAMIAMGAGGLDVALAMAGIPYKLTLPKVCKVELRGQMPHGTSAKDIILKVLELESVKGGVGKIYEYTGPGVKTLSVPERSTICNMGAELGATTSLFPSDENTKVFLEKQGRSQDFLPMAADPGCSYDQEIIINLDELEPLVACPHSPDNIKKVRELEDLKVDQVCIGSCTNSSFTDYMQVRDILKGHSIHPDVSLTLSFGSKQVLTMLAQNGALADLVQSGARILEATCGPCIGMGQSPKSQGISLRTFNRNFKGRSGTPDASVYLVSPETAAASAIKGYLSTAVDFAYERADLPDRYLIDDSMIIRPDLDPAKPVVKGPNIKDVPLGRALEPLHEHVMLKVGDNITTDHIIPAGSRVLPFRSNIEKISEFTFEAVDADFVARCKDQGGGFIVAGENYGQGSSREHAALAPLYLGIRAVLAKSFARIHRKNLINNAIVPLLFLDASDYDDISLMDRLEMDDIVDLAPGSVHQVKDLTSGKTFTVKHDLTEDEILTIKKGGLLRRYGQVNKA